MSVVEDGPARLYETGPIALERDWWIETSHVTCPCCGWSESFVPICRRHAGEPQAAAVCRGCSLLLAEDPQATEQVWPRWQWWRPSTMGDVPAYLLEGVLFGQKAIRTLLERISALEATVAELQEWRTGEESGSD